MMMLLSGIGMGVAFDSYRVVSNRLHIGRLWIPILDLLYWLAATLIVFRVLMANNDGEVRIYIFFRTSYRYWVLFLAVQFNSDCFCGMVNRNNPQIAAVSCTVL